MKDSRNAEKDRQQKSKVFIAELALDITGTSMRNSVCRPRWIARICSANRLWSAIGSLRRQTTRMRAAQCSHAAGKSGCDKTHFQLLHHTASKAGSSKAGRKTTNALDKVGGRGVRNLRLDLLVAPAEQPLKVLVHHARNLRGTNTQQAQRNSEEHSATQSGREQGGVTTKPTRPHSERNQARMGTIE